MECTCCNDFSIRRSTANNPLPENVLLMRLATITLRLRHWWPSMLPKSVNGRGLHFKIADPVRTKMKTGQPVDQIRMAEA